MGCRERVAARKAPEIKSATEPGDADQGAFVDRSSILRASTKRELGFYLFLQVEAHFCVLDYRTRALDFGEFGQFLDRLGYFWRAIYGALPALFPIADVAHGEYHSVDELKRTRPQPTHCIGGTRQLKMHICRLNTEQFRSTNMFIRRTVTVGILFTEAQTPSITCAFH